MEVMTRLSNHSDSLEISLNWPDAPQRHALAPRPGGFSYDPNDITDSSPADQGRPDESAFDLRGAHPCHRRSDVWTSSESPSQGGLSRQWCRTVVLLRSRIFTSWDDRNPLWGISTSVSMLRAV